MKKILLSLLLVIFFVSPAFPITKIIDLPLSSDLIDTESTLSAGELKRVSGGTYITSGLLQTARGNRTNLVLHSADQSNAAWVVNNATKDGSELITFTAQNGYIRQSVATVETGYYYISCYIKNIDGNTALHLYHQDSATGNSTAKTVTLSSVRYSVLVQGKTGGGNVIFGLQDQNAAGHGQVEFTEIQVEKLEGPSAPPGVELVTNGDCAIDSFTEGAGWAHDAGNEEYDCDGSQAARSSLYQNAHLVTGQVYYASFTVKNYAAGNVRLRTGDGTNCVFVADVAANGTYTGIGIATGANPNIIVDADDAFVGSVDDISVKEITFPGPLEPGTYTATAGATATIPAEARFEDSKALGEGEGTNWALHSRDLSNAAWVKTNCTGTKNQTGLDGVASSASLLTASANNATCLQTITLTSTAKTYSVYIKRSVGSGTISMTDDNGANYTACASLSSTAFTKYEITRTQADPVIGFKIATDTDAIIVDCNKLEETAFSTSPIPTTTSPVTRTTEAGNSADNGVKWTMGAAVMNALAEGTIAGTLIFDWTPGYDHDEDSGNYSIISCQDNYQSLVYVAGASALSSYDGTTVASVNLNWVAGTTYTIGLRWSDADNVLQIGVRQAESAWSWGASQALDATGFTIGADDELKLGYECEFPYHISRLTFWDDAFDLNRVTFGAVGGTVDYVLYDLTDGGYFDGPLVTGAGWTFENLTVYNPFGIAFDVDETCAVTNCILEGYDKDIDIAAAKTVTGKHNCLQHHTGAADNIGAGTYTNTSSVFATEPGFRNLSGQDFHLTCGSVCIDAGFSTGAGVDVSGRVTPRGAGEDIGCYEMNCGGCSLGMSLKIKGGFCPRREDR